MIKYTYFVNKINKSGRVNTIFHKTMDEDRALEFYNNTKATGFNVIELRKNTKGVMKSELLKSKKKEQ